MSKLEEINLPFRQQELAKNRYSYNNEYNPGSKDVKSDGDNYGKDTNNGDTGSLDDIKARKTLLAKNKFSYNKEYNQGTA